MDIIRFILLILFVFIVAILYEKYIYPFGIKCRNYKFYYELATEDLQPKKAKRMLKKCIIYGCYFVLGHILMILSTLMLCSIII